MEQRLRPQDRRKSVRLTASCPCAHARFDDEGRPYDQRPSKSTNVSLEGVALRSKFPVDPGELLKITMALGEDLVTFRGKVTYVTSSRDKGYEFGVSIRDIDKMDRIALTRFVYYFKASKAP